MALCEAGGEFACEASTATERRTRNLAACSVRCDKNKEAMTGQFETNAMAGVRMACGRDVRTDQAVSIFSSQVLNCRRHYRRARESSNGGGAEGVNAMNSGESPCSQHLVDNPAQTIPHKYLYDASEQIPLGAYTLPDSQEFGPESHQAHRSFW